MKLFESAKPKTKPSEQRFNIGDDVEVDMSYGLKHKGKITGQSDKRGISYFVSGIGDPLLPEQITLLKRVKGGKITEAIDTTKPLDEASAKELAMDIEAGLKKFISPKRGLKVYPQKIMGDYSVGVLFTKNREEDKAWAHGIWRNDPAVVQYSVDIERGKCEANLIDNTRYINHKRNLGKNPMKKTGTVDQVIQHIGKYLQEVDKNIDKYED